MNCKFISSFPLTLNVILVILVILNKYIIGVGRIKFKPVDFKNELLKRFSDERLEGLKQEDA